MPGFPILRLFVHRMILGQHPYFGQIYDLRFFCEIDSKEQLRRIRRRNGDTMAKRFRREWIPRENRYFKAFHIKENSIDVPSGFPYDEHTNAL